jgi:molybdopterin molybdotransferase
MGYHAFGQLRSVAEVRRLLEREVRPVARRETVPLEQALGRVSFREHRAQRPVPEFPRASWDGYAVRSRDTTRARPGAPVRLSVVGAQFAEGRRLRRLGAGEAVEIATGGALPPGADTVAIYEIVRREGDTIWFEERLAAGDRVAEVGEDFHRGDRLVAAGEPLGPAALGALAATGAARVEVYARPRVVIVPNGNELRLAGERLGPGEIYEANHVALASVCAASGAEVSWMAPLKDDPAAIEAGLRRALGKADLVLVTGGSSVGERDYLPRVFPKLGRLLFHGVAVRPGKPTLAAVARGRLLLGLPGHPTSCLSNAYWLVLPLLRRLARLPGTGWTEVEARMAEPYAVGGGRFATVVPLAVQAGWARPTFKDSSAITSLSGANGFLLRSPVDGRLRRGESVTVQLLPYPVGQPPSPPTRGPQGYRRRRG